MGTIKDYREMVGQPWGRMFYDLIFRQLDIPDNRRTEILDFGAGFCITADHYARLHDVTALEPNKEMYDLRSANNGYRLITQGIEYLDEVGDNSFNTVICHNVLEYAEDRASILKQLTRVLRPGGILSVVKHNTLGRAMACAVFGDDPAAAAGLLSKERVESSMFGSRELYTNEQLIDMLGEEMTPEKIFGIRTFYGLSSNNEIKYSKEWYSAMLELEITAGSIEEYRKVAFFNHLLFRKKEV